MIVLKPQFEMKIYEKMLLQVIVINYKIPQKSYDVPKSNINTFVALI